MLLHNGMAPIKETASFGFNLEELFKFCNNVITGQHLFICNLFNAVESAPSTASNGVE